MGFNLYLCSPYYEKIIYSCVAGFLSFYANAQVGIGTTKPKTTLDVNGKTTLRKELRVGGTSTDVGKAGLNGQVLVSQGKVYLLFGNHKIPFMEEGQYKLINSYLSSDQVGISGLSNGVDGDGVNKNSVGDDITDAAKANG
jgi:hypothetical protein